MSKPASIDWHKYTPQVQSLEARLEALLSLPPYSSDDRRLSRVYVGLAGLIANRLSPELREYLSLAELYSNTGVFPLELEGISERLHLMSQSRYLEDASGSKATGEPFIYQLVESTTRRKFGIDPAICADPIAWIAALGVPSEEIERVVTEVYPELDAPTYS